MWSRFVFELAICPQEVTLVRWTQPSGPLCLWQCLDDTYIYIVIGQERVKMYPYHRLADLRAQNPFLSWEQIRCKISSSRRHIWHLFVPVCEMSGTLCFWASSAGSNMDTHVNWSCSQFSLSRLIGSPGWHLVYSRCTFWSTSLNFFICPTTFSPNAKTLFPFTQLRNEDLKRHGSAIRCL